LQVIAQNKNFNSMLSYSTAVRLVVQYVGVIKARSSLVKHITPKPYLPGAVTTGLPRGDYSIRVSRSRNLHKVGFLVVT